MYGIGIFLTLLGFLLFFKTEWMLKFTEFFENLIGVIWIPSQKTERIYKVAGLFFISFGCAYLGYIFGMK